ncbi:hypothetical protein GOM49_11440 [Clostridium bovifaecis]|uniref:Methyl-accepting transducer domain-containing protein n=1 Tax=Clostridium bovifaecis TaxID=2184719 RepID=A0A6I6EZ97_9CLOT|nr:hypothetical protein GOM49_11440 [Clostridium bovifaecis]
MGFIRRKKLETIEDMQNEVQASKPSNVINKGKYQSIMANKIAREAEEAIDVTAHLLENVKNINIEIEKHNEYLEKTVQVATDIGVFSEEVNSGVDETILVIEDTLKKAVVSQESVQQMINSIDDVQSTVESMEDVIKALSDRAKEIKGIVDTIKGIAKTTHLLSLNANIEAARAGEAGRGFSIVAGEVKNLAENSSSSAGEIDNIINEITAVIQNTLEVIVKGVEKVGASNKVAKEAEASIDNMMKSVEKTKEISNEINNFVKEQSEKNQYMISVIDEMVQASEKVEAFNENISVNADRQKASLISLKDTIVNLNQLACIDKTLKEMAKSKFTMSSPFSNVLDPANATDISTSNIVFPINLGLVQFGTGTEVISGIAKNWHLESDNLTWNFNIRKGMKFHNGRNIIAEDIKFSFERLLSRELDSPNRWFLEMIQGADEFYEGNARGVSGIRVINDYNLKIILKYPYSSFINNLAHCSCSILPKECIHSVNESPVGAGPYKFVSKDDKKIIFEKMEGYPLGEALIDTIEIFIDMEDDTEKFINGELDYIAVNGSNIDKIKDMGYDIHKTECIGMRFISFNFRSRNDIISNRYCRQALNLCVDKERIIKEAFGGLETEAKGAIPSSLLENRRDSDCKRNISKAKEIMYKSGVKGSSLTMNIIKKSPFQGKIAQIVKENFKEIGVNLNIVEIESKSYYEEANLKECDLFIYGWLGDSGTADNFIEPLIDINNASNRGKYNKSSLMKYLNECKKTKNPYKYRDLINNLEKEIIDDSPWILISNICVSYAFQKNVKGLKVHALNQIKLWDIWKE